MPSSSCHGVGAPALSMDLDQARAAQGVPRNIMGAITSRFDQAAAATGVDPAKAADLKQALRDAIKEARHSATKGESKAAAVGDAVAKVLADYGLDAAAFMKALAPKGHHRGQPIDPAPTSPTTPPAAETPVSVDQTPPVDAAPLPPAAATIDVIA